MFIDEVTIDLEAGSGGNGCMAFRREKYVEMGGPYGGNGGKGADIIFKVDEGLNTLLDLRYKKLIRGDKGENGLGKGMHGAAAENVIVKVPEGTVITDMDTGLIIADLVKNGEEAVVAHGGRGGRGNIAFATRSNPAPNFAENGEPGEVKRVKVELKLLADVGLVGLPSVGKSTFISKISAVKPKIAAYHFTTLKPNLGVVRASNNRSFVVADLPGLIKGASLGEGLGDKFLKHIERTRVIAHVIDMSGYEGRDPYDDYIKIKKELNDFDSKLLKKEQLIIANKMDMENSEENVRRFKEKYPDIPVYETTTIIHEGLETVLRKAADLLATTPVFPITEDTGETGVMYTFEEKKKDIIIEKEEDGVWNVSGPRLERVFDINKLNTEEDFYLFANKMRYLGIDTALREAGCQDGDTVRLLGFEFEFIEN